jgi:wyosine [tRNA(Phe)-imidazoG37] synthetase (radical SAM superfamily)
MINQQHISGDRSSPVHPAFAHEAAYGYPRDFLENQYVYLLISPRAGGLSVGLNLNPELTCHFNCLYCEINRSAVPRTEPLDVDRMTVELRQTMELVRGGWLRQWPRYKNLPENLLQIQHVALSGDGEPTLSPNFFEAVRSVIMMRASDKYFKIVLLTNSAALDQPGIVCAQR